MFQVILYNSFYWSECPSDLTFYSSESSNDSLFLSLLVRMSKWFYLSHFLPVQMIIFLLLFMTMLSDFIFLLVRMFKRFFLFLSLQTRGFKWFSLSVFFDENVQVILLTSMYKWFSFPLYLLVWMLKWLSCSNDKHV